MSLKPTSHKAKKINLPKHLLKGTEASSPTQEIISFYRFIDLSQSNLEDMQKKLLQKGQALKLRGLILLSQEGINVTISGLEPNLTNYLSFIENLTGINDFFYKKSFIQKPAFKALRIKVKKEIINSKKNTSPPAQGFYDLEPEEWEAMLNEQNLNLLDIRNDYEVEIGKFKKALTMGLKEFSEFPQKLKQKVNLPKDQKTLVYCTGGIRCEKAITEMKNQGFKEVYQLKGGIIHYLKTFPNKSFKGECFVFDHRVAVDQNLHPSEKYSLCPHCGQAGAEVIKCSHCRKPAKVCGHCLKKAKHFITCSKNCAHHFRLGHKCKKVAKT